MDTQSLKSKLPTSSCINPIWNQHFTQNSEPIRLNSGIKDLPESVSKVLIYKKVYDNEVRNPKDIGKRECDSDRIP